MHFNIKQILYVDCFVLQIYVHDADDYDCDESHMFERRTLTLTFDWYVSVLIYANWV